MTDTLAYLRGHRLWVIRDFAVWGSLAAHEFSFLVTVQEQAGKRIMFLSVPLGGELQKVSFAELVDFRGNNLPATIVNPKVIPIPKSGVGVVIVGQEDAETFMIAKTSPTDPGGICDLLIVEVG